MSAKNTIIVITGNTGHEYVATVGRIATITPVLDAAACMSAEQATEVMKQISGPAELRDLDEYRVERGRSPSVNARLEHELQTASD